MIARDEQPDQSFIEGGDIVARKSAEQRIKFIPELRAKITEGLALTVRTETIERAFEQWDAGEEPGGYVIAAIFDYFRNVQKEVESQNL